MLITDQKDKPCFLEVDKKGLVYLDPVTHLETDRAVLALHLYDAIKWKDFISYYESPDLVLVSQKLDPLESYGKVTGQIDRIQFLRLGLSFTVDITGRFKSDQYPDYYLAKQQVFPSLENLQGAFLLESSDGKQKKVILPAMGLKEKKNPLTDMVKFDHEILIEGLEKPYFSFNVSKNNLSLIPESPRGALFLSLIYRAQKNYKLSFEALQSTLHMSHNEDLDWQIIKNAYLLASPDSSPEATALDCHIGFRMEAHEEKYTREKFKNTPRSEEIEGIIKKFNEMIKEQGEAYHARSSEWKEGVLAIPSYLRLTHQQELKILPKEEVADLGKFMDLTSDLVINHLSDGDIESTIKKGPSKSDKDIPKTFVRLPTGSDPERSIKTHFLDLYMEAKSLSGKDDRTRFKIKLFYLSRHFPENRIPREIKYIFKLLTDVMENPKAYDKIEMDLTDGDSKGKCFKEISKVFQERAEKNLLSSKPWIVLPSTLKPTEKKPVSDTHVKPITLPQLPFSLTSNPVIQALSTYPLKEIAERVIDHREEKTIPQCEFALDKVDLTKTSPLSQKQILTLKEGYLLNNKKTATSYTLNEVSEQTIHEGLKQSLQEDEVRVKELTKQIEGLANITEGDKQKSLSHSEFLHYLGHHAKQRTGQVDLLKMKDLLGYFLTRDTESIKKVNPALSNLDIQEINNKILELILLSSKLNQTEEAMKISQSIVDAQDNKEELRLQLAAVLDRKRQFNPLQKPEYAAYEFASGMMLRADQVELIDWVIACLEKGDIQSLLFQFAAGGGKTKVLLPILAFILAQKGYFPVGLNISALYEIGTRDLEKSLLDAFKQRLELLEIELETKLSAEKIENINADLKQWHLDKKCLSLKTETWHAINLKYQQALEQSKENEIEAFYQLRHFFETVAVSLTDEGHQSLNSLHEANTAIGKPTTIPLKQQRLCTKLFMKLAGYEGNLVVNTKDRGFVKIQELVRLIENKQSLLTDDDLTNVRNALLPEILKDPVFEEIKKNPLLLKLLETPEKIAKELTNYLQNKDSERPAWLDALHKSNSTDNDLASLVVFAKKFLYETTPYTLHLIRLIQYGDSVHLNDFTCAPKHNKQNVTSKFQDVYVTLALTIQNHLQSGLNEKSIVPILQILLKEHARQKKTIRSNVEITKAQALMNLWWKEEGAPNLDFVFLDNKARMKEIANKIGRNSDVLEKFLLRVALPLILAFPEKINSTPPDLLDGFCKNVVFTATPGLMETYPHQLQNPTAVKLDLGFEASVLQTLCAPYNSTIKSVSFENLDQLFNQLFDEAHGGDPALLTKLCAIIDQGGIFRSFENKEVIEKLISFAKAKGISFNGGIYRKEAEGILKSETGQLIYKTGNKDLPLKGSDLRQALKSLGEDFDKVLLATLFDRAITTGADILQPFLRKGVLSVGEDSTKTNMIQAAMRLRKLLLGEKGQSVVWMLQKELEAQIPKSKDELTVQDLMLWMINNEAVLTEKAIVMRAFQGIQHLVRNIAWKQINAPGLSSQERISLYKKFREGLVEHLEYDPYLTFGKKLEMKDTLTVLTHFAETCATKLGIKKDQLETALSEKDRASYHLILKQTSELVKKIQTANSQMAQEMHQESRQEVEQEQKQESEQSVAFHIPVEEKYPYDMHTLMRSDFLSPSYFSKDYKVHTSLKAALGLNAFPSDLFIALPALGVREGFKKTELKPLRYLLVIQDQGKPAKYLVCSRKGAAHYKEQLMSGAIYKGRKAMLVDVEGKVVQHATGAGYFDKNERKKILDSEPFKDRLALISLLSGEVTDFNRIKRIAKEEWTHDDFVQLCDKIRSIHVGNKPIDEETLEEIRKFKKKKKAVVEDLSEHMTMGNIFK